MRKWLVAIGSALTIAAFAAPAALGAPNPAGTGQPGTASPNGVSCPRTITSPAGFNTAGFANAATHYAGSPGTPSAANGSAHAVSEYDIACYQTSQSHG